MPADARPMRDTPLGRLDAQLERRSDGTIIVRSPFAEPSYNTHVTQSLDHWARQTPDATFIAERDASGQWRRITYAQALNAARSIGQALLNRNLNAERPLLILSGNDIEHALLALGALYVGVPYAPISTAYSLVSSDCAKIAHVVKLLTPGLVFAADGKAYGRAIELCVPKELEVVTTRGAPPSHATTAFAELLATPPTDTVAKAHAAIQPDDVAKFLFTSGSTAMPKAVINTHRMMCANQAMIAYTFPFLKEEPPVIVDWLPWNHTFGGNHNFGIVLTHGGSLYIDDGKPIPGGIEKTVRNLRELAPTIYLNVPKGYESLIPYLRAEPELAKKFFSRLRLNFFAGASLSQHIWDALDEIALQTCGERIIMMSGLGATETAPSALFCTKETSRSGGVGLPLPGVELKLVPNGGKLEVRLKGSNVTPGYWRQDDITAKSFDEEGYYCLGDALKFADENNPSLGFFFDGRVSEDFKLATGTWVSVGPLRARFIAAFAPLVKDVVIAGHNRDDIGVLVLPDMDACRELVPELPANASAHDVLHHPKVTQKFTELLNAFKATSTGSSTRVERAILMTEPLSIDANEITDKGSVNQRAVLAHRDDLVEMLYAEVAAQHVLSAA